MMGFLNLRGFLNLGGFPLTYVKIIGEFSHNVEFSINLKRGAARCKRDVKQSGCGEVAAYHLELGVPHVIYNAPTSVKTRIYGD